MLTSTRPAAVLSRSLGQCPPRAGWGRLTHSAVHLAASKCLEQPLSVMIRSTRSDSCATAGAIRPLFVPLRWRVSERALLMEHHSSNSDDGYIVPKLSSIARKLPFQACETYGASGVHLRRESSRLRPVLWTGVGSCTEGGEAEATACRVLPLGKRRSTAAQRCGPAPQCELPGPRCEPPREAPQNAMSVTSE